jgi:Transcriptional regulatory protein, C terminal
MRVLVIADGKSSGAGELVDILNRNGNHAYRVSAEHIAPEIIDGSDIILTVREKIRIDSDVPVIAVSDATPCGLADTLAKIVAAAGSKDHSRVSAQPEVVRVGDITVGIKNFKVTVGDKPVELTKKEFQILALLATEEGAMCSREKIAAEAWGLPESDVYDSIHVLVSRLRAKLGHERIRTVRSIGYQLVTGEDP